MKRKAAANRRPAKRKDAATVAAPAAPVPSADLPHIEIFPRPFGGPARDRFDVTIRGRVICSVPVDEVRLEADGLGGPATGLGGASIGQPAVTPDGAPAQQRPIQFTLTRPLSALPAE